MRFQKIQILRFAAALGVVLFHSAIYVTNDRPAHMAGWFGHYLGSGVLLFFAISGFVIMRPAMEKRPAAFLALRFLRIFPPFWLLALVASLGKLAVFGVQRFDLDLAKALTLLPFGTIPYPLGIEWSLVYEVFFYLTVAFIVITLGARWLPAMIAAWGAAVVACAFTMPATTVPLPTFVQVAFSAYDFPFICGALAFFAYGKGVRMPMLPAIVLTALLMVLSARFPLAVALLIQGLGFSVLVLAAASYQSGASAARTALVKGGDWSYGLYLAHVPVIQLMVHSRHFAGLSGDALFVACAVVALAVGLSYGALELAAYRRVAKRLGGRGPSVIGRPVAKSAI